jgi:hypothetical protein
MVRESTLVMFNEHSAGAIVAERSLHEGFLKNLDVAREEAKATEVSPTTLAYTSQKKVKLLQWWQAQRAPRRLLSQPLLGFLACCYKF